MYFPELGRRMKFIKSKTAEDSDMNSILERFKEEGREEGLIEGLIEGREEGREEGLIEGREEGRKEGRQEGQVKGILSQKFSTILRMIGDGCDDMLITKYTDATSDEIEAARRQLSRVQV